MNTTERKLSEMHSRSGCVLVGSGTMGLMLSLQALGIRSSLIAVPNNSCFNVIQAIYYSQNMPLFLDIDKDDFGLSPLALRKAKGYAAVIAIHAYGRICQIEAISAICKDVGVPLIEDLAAAQGANNKGIPTGSYGDLSVMSFGAGKIIDIGHGGATLSNDPILLNVIKRLTCDLPSLESGKEGRMDAVSKLHTWMYNNQYLESVKVQYKKFVFAIEQSKSDFMFRFDQLKRAKLERQLEQLEYNITSRQKKAERFFDELSFNSEIIPLIHQQGDVYWRFNILFKHSRDRILKRLLAYGLPISSWHPSVDIFFRNRSLMNQETPISDRIGKQILNLWVNDTVDQNYEATVISIIKHELGVNHV